MSELKAYTIYEGDVGNYTEHVVYSKSEADQVIEHNKYKRCLAMAKWCEIGISYWDDDEQEGGWEYKKLHHCIRWKKRWLELAEKFKPNKE